MPRLWERASIAAAIHDLGKCCAGFQKTVQGKGKFIHRHEILSLALIPWLFTTDPEGDIPWIAAAVATHHKDLATIEELYPDEVEFDGLDDLQSELTAIFLETAQKVFRDSLYPMLAESGEVQLSFRSEPWIPGNAKAAIRPVLDSATELARRIRKLGAGSAESTGALFLRGLLLLSDHAGSAGEKFRTLEAIRSERQMLLLLGVDVRKLYPHQRDVSPGNATLIAPTGSGKTEASLLWAARTGQIALGSPVLFYVLPYQASINAMQARLAGHFGSPQVALQHSRATQAIYRQLLDRNYEPAVAGIVARKERSLASLHTKPVRVLTPYQLLRAAFQLKGHEALWTDASSGLMIFDEIHAYEPVRLGMILATIRHLTRKLGVRALIMSATLPRRLLRVISDVLPAAGHLAATPETFREFRRHRVHLVEGDLLDGSIEERVLADAAEGKAVLVVATTVGRAQEFYGRLAPELGKRVSLLHGRFHADDRFDKEKDLARQRGPGGSEPVVLVATQVVEVSLDVDFDVLYSDPAPLEALIQRFGRVNRRRQAPLRDVFVMKAVPEGSPVYKDRIIALALERLGGVDQSPLDEGMVQEMLDSIYDGPFGDSWLSELTGHMADFQRNVLDSLYPFQSSDELEKQFDDMFDGFQVLPASLEEEYVRRMEEDELSAPGLLVPITRGQFFAIKPQRRNNVLVADRPYTRECGLEVKGPRREDGV